MPEATMFLSKAEAQAVEDSKARRIRHMKELAEREEAERKAGRLVAEPQSPAVAVLDIDVIAKLRTEIARIAAAERATAGTLGLLRAGESRIQERVGDSELDQIVNGASSTAERLSRVRNQIAEMEHELLTLADSRLKKETAIDRLRGSLKENAENKRRKLLQEMRPLLDKAQALSQAADSIFYTAREIGVELDTYMSGPSIFSLPGVIEAGRRFTRANATSRYDDWKANMIAKGVL